MKKIKKPVAFVITLLFAGSIGAVASGEDYDELTAGGADHHISTIYGGTTQSTDPTRWDYVPAVEPSDNAIEPLNANGGQPIGGITISVNGLPIGIPKMVLRHSITGTGLKVTAEDARIETTGATVCNYRFDFQNRYGNKIYRTDSTGTYKKCVINSGWVKNSTAPFTTRHGNQCVRLYSNGVYVGEQCHSMHK